MWNPIPSLAMHMIEPFNPPKWHVSIDTLCLCHDMKKWPLFLFVCFQPFFPLVIPPFWMEIGSCVLECRFCLPVPIECSVPVAVYVIILQKRVSGWNLYIHHVFYKRPTVYCAHDVQPIWMHYFLIAEESGEISTPSNDFTLWLIALKLSNLLINHRFFS